MDEITERPAQRPLPAPTGPRSPTGPVQLIAPPSVIPPPMGSAPVVPYLPAIVPKAAAPLTGEVSTTHAVAAMLNLQNQAASTKSPPPKRGRKKWIVLAIVVVITLLLAVLFRNSAFVGRFTGKGYDTNPLPVEAFPQPVFTGAVYTLTTQSVAVSDGLPTNFWRTERDEVDYTAKVAKLTIDRAKASVIGGMIGTPQSTSPAVDVVVDGQSTYVPGATATDPWTRSPHDPGWGALSVLSPHQVMMYQDIIDPALRAQHPTSVIEETRHDVPVTTFTYAVAFGAFYESAPRLFDLVRVVDGNAGSDARVIVTVSFDDAWVVRYLDVDIDYRAVLKYKAESDPEVPYPYRYTVDVVSTTQTPPRVSVPTNVVDATTTTTTVVTP